jgi:succinate dehydrogenase/fumarate reductase flavoprotein subunit
MVGRLVVEDGAVTGAIASGPGGDVRIHARAGVVLAAGGFSHDPAQRAEAFPSCIAADHHVSPMTAEHDGASLRLAEQAGGYLDRSVVHPAAWASVSVFERGRTFPHLRGVGLPGIIAVNARGERFVNEADSYHDFGPALMASTGDEVRAFLIADARAMHQYGLGYAKPWPMPRLRYRLGGYLHSGRTLEMLARRIGVDPQRLTRTVGEFNRDAATGIDSAFGRGVGAFNLFKGDPDNKPNPTLRPLSKGPYYATEVRIGDLGTFAGIATGLRARVLRRDGTPVPGLHAVGSAAASVFGGSYPGAGAHLGPAMTFGYLAGLDLAAGRADPAPADDTPARG